MAVEQAVDEVQIARAATAGAHRERPGQVGLGAGGEGTDFLVPDMDPFDLALPAQRVRQSVQAVANDAIDALDARRGQNLYVRLRFAPKPDKDGRPLREGRIDLPPPINYQDRNAAT